MIKWYPGKKVPSHSCHRRRPTTLVASFRSLIERKNWITERDDALCQRPTLVSLDCVTQISPFEKLIPARQKVRRITAWNLITFSIVEEIHRSSVLQDDIFRSFFTECRIFEVFHLQVPLLGVLLGHTEADDLPYCCVSWVMVAIFFSLAVNFLGDQSKCWFTACLCRHTGVVGVPKPDRRSGTFV